MWDLTIEYLWILDLYLPHDTGFKLYIIKIKRNIVLTLNHQICDLDLPEEGNNWPSMQISFSYICPIKYTINALHYIKSRRKLKLLS